MITIYKTDNLWRKENDKEFISGELRGLSRDTKPTKIGESFIDNGSVFVEIDTGKMYLYDLDNEQWNEV